MTDETRFRQMEETITTLRAQLFAATEKLRAKEQQGDSLALAHAWDQRPCTVCGERQFYAEHFSVAFSHAYQPDTRCECEVVDDIEVCGHCGRKRSSHD
jgi:DNA repair exonuclease SbcCD ATPase subunit